MITVEMLEAITGKKATPNMVSLVVGLEAYPAGIDKPHRAAHFIAQVAHESQGFKYDKEIWGPTPAQKRYDTRTDLGNTAAVDGDGKKYAGRTPMQVTGKSNYRQFTDWCRMNVSMRAPDFVADPDAINSDPWEGLGPVWYWDTRKLNVLADRGDLKAITKKINGGYNGLADRELWYGTVALVLLGYSRNGAKAFQSEHGLTPDGVIGPKTREAMHAALVKAGQRKPVTTVTPSKPATPAPIVTGSLWARFVEAIIGILKGKRT